MTRSVWHDRLSTRLRHRSRSVGPSTLLSDLEPRARRVLILASAVVFFETIFFTALAPLLPHYEASLGISKSKAGILTATYAAGAFVGAVPGGFLALRWGVRAIAAVFLVSSLITVFATPRLGKWSDRQGRAPPIIAGLTASLLASLGLAATGSLAFAVFVVAAAVAFSSTWVPATALLSDGIEQAGIGLAIGFILFNLAWTPGFLAGAAGGGWLASAIGDSPAYLVLAILCALTLLGALVFAGRPGAWDRQSQ
jgi:MFS family permease